jgi:hypothetical protein
MVWKYENGVYRKKFISPVSLGTYTEEIDAGDLDGGSSFPDNEVVIWGTGMNKIYVMKYDDPNPGDDIYGTFHILTQLTFKSGLRELCVSDVDGASVQRFGRPLAELRLTPLTPGNILPLEITLSGEK